MHSPSSPVLRRGEACAECRRRKLRCNGARPSCSICIKTDRKCRYETIIARPVYLVLQERLSALERRYEHLTSTSASEADLSNMNNSDPILPPTPLHDMAGQWWETEELAPAMRDYLLNIFCLHRASIHFTFHEPTFKARLAAPEEAERPHRALLESIYLLACYFSARLPNNQSLVHHEEHFLKRARQALMESLSYSDRLMDFLMGSILLTQYLYMRGRWLEGYHVHCGAARFALSCGLHQLPSHIYYSPLYNKPVTANVVLLPAPTSGIELGERISTFWMLYMCDKLSSIAAGFVCALPTETDAVDAVETVFPRAMEEYEVNDVNEFETCNLRFLFDPTSASAAEGARQGTPWTVTIKGFAILERAVKLSTVHRARPTGDSAIALRCLELAANRVLSTLPPIAHYAQESTSTENMTKDDMAAYIAHNTVLGALMEIHQALDELDDKAHYALLSCAKRTADLTACVKEEGLAQAYLIAVGFCWCLAARVIIHHIESIGDGDEQLDAYEPDLSKLVSALEKLSLTFPTLVQQFKHVGEALGRLATRSVSGALAEERSESE